jgi:hypothetical protein
MFVSSEHPRNTLPPIVFCPLTTAATHTFRGKTPGPNNNASCNHNIDMAATARTPQMEITTASKRGRDGYPARDCEQNSPQLVVSLGPVEEAMASTATAPSTKKIRTNDYRPPQKVPLSFTSQVGSFAVGQVIMGNSKRDLAGGRAVVGLRRQLSSSKIEAFLSSGDDAMDVDAEPTRPRSMSL